MENSNEQGLSDLSTSQSQAQKEHREDPRLAYKLPANFKLGFISCTEFKNSLSQS